MIATEKGSAIIRHGKASSPAHGNIPSIHPRTRRETTAGGC
jgi:hypothetical protein